MDLVIDNSSVLLTVLIALITAVIGPAIVELVKSRLSKKKDDMDPMFREMEADILITDRLRSVLEEKDYDRIWIIQFHNGGNYYSSGISIKKFSMFFEVVNNGISSIKDKFQNVPTTFFSKSISEVNTHGELHIPDICSESIRTYGLKETMESTGSQSLFFVGLKSPNGKLHGVLGVDRVKEANPFTEEEKEEIKELGTYVTGILELIHKMK